MGVGGGWSSLWLFNCLRLFLGVCRTAQRFQWVWCRSVGWVGIRRCGVCGRVSPRKMVLVVLFVVMMVA